MYPEQTLRSMTLNELVSYSETFSDIPATLAKALAERALQAISYAVELEWEIGDLKDGIEEAENLADECESKLDILEANVKAAMKELDSAEPDLDLVRMYLGE
jgi:predicted  nucleic acid-binding Zn-ribbon protein